MNECFLIILATLGLLGLILPFFDERNALPSNAKPYSSEAGNYAEYLPKEENKTRSILMCERSF